MATEFAIWLVGDDEEQLTAIGEAALDEVQRVESVLSRFDPAAELARLNRYAAKNKTPLKISIELFQVLQNCLDWYEKTKGHFDIGWMSDRGEFNENLVHLDAAAKTASSPLGDPQLDLGGFGKGYALDRAAQVVKQFEIDSALLHGGTSSVLAIGKDPHGDRWRIDLRDPLADSPDIACGRLGIATEALSTSAERRLPSAPGEGGIPFGQSCTVVCDSAAEAEVYSTALLGMGKSKAKEYLEGIQNPPRAVVMIEHHGGRGPGPIVDWLVGNPYA